MSEKVQQLLEDLSYSFSSPEADHFHHHLINRQFGKAKKMLTDYMSKEDADLLVDHLHTENTRRVSMVEFEIKDLDLKNKEQRYLIKAGRDFGTSTLCRMGDCFGFFVSSSFIVIDKVSQIWKIV